MNTNADPVRALADLAERAVPFLRDEAAKYDDDGSNEPLELAREIETALASLPSDESALSSANSAFDGGREAALASAPPSAGEVPPEDRFEQFVQAEIARSPNALRELGCYLADVLDEDRFPRANRLLLQLATEYAPPSAPEPEVHSYDPTEHRESVTIRWPDGKCLSYVLDRTRYTDNLPPSAPVGVDAKARRLYEMIFDAIAEDGSQQAEDACIRAIASALAQQPAPPSVEAVAYRWRDRGTMQMIYSSTNPGYCNVEHLYAAPQQPAAVDGGLTDEAIERALEARLGLDHTLRQLIRGDTMPVGYSKVEVVRALLRALAAQQQGGAA